jgi:serine/threonine protein kinase
VEFSIGDTAGDYQIIGELGKGGMGTVFKVRHLISDRVEAMKVVRPEHLESSEVIDRFIREIKVQARLNHPNIASLHNAIRWEDHFLMVMEYVEGATLSAFMRQGALDPGQSVYIILQALSALAYAHAQGVVHRDIKPANIIITPAGTAKLMDFGIARSFADSNQLTQAGAVVGSYHYMSPEQIQSAPVDARSDLYSTGIMLYEMVTGVRPITGDSSWSVMNAHITQIPRSPAMLNHSLPAAFSLAILKAIQKGPAERFQSATEFAQMLGSLQNRYPQLAYGNSAPPQLPQMPASREFLSPHRNTDSPLASLPPNMPTVAVATPSPTPQSYTPSAHTPSSDTPATPASDAKPRTFEAADLEGLKRELAAYVGPMAKILVDRAARKAKTLRQLYETLAEEVPAGEERKRFLATRQR